MKKKEVCVCVWTRTQLLFKRIPPEVAGRTSGTVGKSGPWATGDVGVVWEKVLVIWAWASWALVQILSPQREECKAELPIHSAQVSRIYLIEKQSTHTCVSVGHPTHRDSHHEWTWRLSAVREKKSQTLWETKGTVSSTVTLLCEVRWCFHWINKWSRVLACVKCPGIFMVLPCEVELPHGHHDFSFWSQWDTGAS